MLDRVAYSSTQHQHHGYLEVSLKHSGSLLLWSGGQRFYSKNSTNNKFTKVGELLLMQHFARFYGVDANTNTPTASSSSTTTTTATTSCRWKEEYERCSEYVHKQRLTCSFEVVTSILGHHGDLPKRDYLILIAVADRGWKKKKKKNGNSSCGGVARFYSTNELVKFAHQFRLPHNDIWIFSSISSCEALFDAYDGMRETGTATMVVGKLDGIITKENDADEGEGGGENYNIMMPCTKFTSLYPHLMYQGDILEGIVVRYVPYDTIDITDGKGDALGNWEGMWKEMKKIADTSIELSSLLASSSGGERRDDRQSTVAYDNFLQIDLRNLAEMDDFEEQVKNILQTFHGRCRRRIESENDVREQDSENSRVINSIDVVTVAKDILSSSSSIEASRRYDSETLHIARLIHTLDELRIHAAYKIVREHTTLVDGCTTAERCLCILHIQHDSSFAKYNAFLRNQGNDGGMMLFRGFSFELVTAAGTDQDNHILEGEPEVMDVDVSMCSTAESNNYASEERLMLKMKFLPYMVRTFICRNGLRILQSSGIDAFENYALAQLTSWKVSDMSLKKWMSFFQGWAEYCSSLSNRVNGDNYLHHLNSFIERYASGQFRSSPGTVSSFRGVIIMVAPSTCDLQALPAGISQELRCSKVVHGIKNLTRKDCLMSKRSGGLICTAKIEDGTGSVRRLIQQNDAETFTIIMIQSNYALSSVDDVHSKKIIGMMKSWRKTPCKMILDLPIDSVDVSNEDAILAFLRNNEAAKKMMEHLKDSTKSNELDERPGLLVFFPAIPGSGKSSLCENITADVAERNGRRIVLMESDKVKNQVKGKFYNVVTKEILSQPSSVAILDKNVPPTSFSCIDALSYESRSIALSVLPIGLVDTRVGHDSSSHVYPFPLHYLAACMYHVLSREATTHIGKLDAGTKNACMIVVKFYCLYRHMTVEVLKQNLRKVGYHCQVTQIPFFKELLLPDLPHDLKLALENAISLQTTIDLRICNIANDDSNMAAMEEKLRTSIWNNREFIRNLTTSVEASRKVFTTELMGKIDSLPNTIDPTLTAKEPLTRSIKIVSLDLELSEVNAAVEKMKDTFPSVRQYFTQREEHKQNDENDKSINRFITSVHVTFAHASEMPQTSMTSSFQHLIGVRLQINATSLLYSEKIAAIEVEIPADNAIPRPMNPFPHITIWCSENSEAYESNNLPEMVNTNQAERVVLHELVRLNGVFRFWYD